MRSKCLSLLTRPLPILLLIVLLGLFLRVWGISNARNPDELFVVGTVRGFYEKGLDPGPKLYYPPFFQYLVALILWVVNKGHGVLNWVLGISPFLETPAVSDENFFLAARLVCALLGTLTLVLVYKVGVLLRFERKVALWATAILALTFLHIDHSHVAILDVPMATMVMIGLAFTSKIVAEGKTRYYLLAGFFCGVAALTKYGGILLLPTIVVAHFLSPKEQGESRTRRRGWMKLPLVILACLAGLFVASPYAFIRAASFHGGLLRFARRNIKGVPWEVDRIPETLWEGILQSNYASGLRNLVFALGITFSLLVLIGFFSLLFSRKKEGYFLLTFPVIYFFAALRILGFSRSRDLIAILPPLALVAAFGWAAVQKKLLRIRPAGLRTVSHGALILTLFLPVLYRNLENIYYFREADTRRDAASWMTDNLPPRKQDRRGDLLSSSRKQRVRLRKSQVPRKQKRGKTD